MNEVEIRREVEGVLLLDGASERVEFVVVNRGSSSVVVKPWLSVPRGFEARLGGGTLRLRPGAEHRVPVVIRATDRRLPRATVTLHVLDSYAWVSVFASDNLLRGATMTASSINAEAWTPNKAADGWFYDQFNAGSGWEWADATRTVFPDWIAGHWTRPVMLSSTRLISTDTAAIPAAENCIRDYDLQVSMGRADQWRTIAQVRGNVSAESSLSFRPVRARALRLVSLSSNNGRTSRILEWEAFSPSGRPRDVWTEIYGGPAAPFPR